MRDSNHGDDALRPVFVVGVPRSGTTWVQRLLAAHPDAWGLLETQMFSRRVGLGALLRTLPDPDLQPDPGTLPPAGLGRLFDRPELVAELGTIAERWLGRSAGEARFVIEKTPWHLSEVSLIAELLPAARFVHVVRDGRDVAVSLVAARRSWSSFGGDRVAGVVREAAELWARGIAEGEHARVIVGERLLELRFEDAHAEPRRACERLFAHCRMPASEDAIERALALASLHGDGEPGGEHRARRGGRVGDWRARFGIADAWRFERRAGEALRLTGYEPDRGWWLRRPPRSRLGR